MVGGGDVSVLAAKSATATIPIVFAIGADPARIGIVDSFNLPGGNITGVSFLSVQIRPKMVELIKELLPNATTIAVLENPHRPHFQQSSSEVTQSAQSAGLQVEVVQASSAREIDAAFLRLQHMRVDALLVMSDPAFINRSTQIVELLTAYRLPSILATRDFVRAGGLLSYGASLDDSYHDAGVYAGRILVGEKPATMPVKQPTKFELSINLKTAKSLGIVVPAALLARADEVIE
jgi:putative tryptophan/tyrosine transport system substrate-binding protein